MPRLNYVPRAKLVSPEERRSLCVSEKVFDESSLRAGGKCEKSAFVESSDLPKLEKATFYRLSRMTKSYCLANCCQTIGQKDEKHPTDAGKVQDSCSCV
jgi:hypothetical protein